MAVPGCDVTLDDVPPAVVFPASAPRSSSGEGALLWNAPNGCGKGVIGGLPTVLDAPLEASLRPVPARELAPGDGLTTLAVAAGTTAGQVLTLGANGPMGAFAESRAGTPPAAQALGGPPAPVAIASGYLGDVVFASTIPAGNHWELAVRVQRHYATAPGRVRVLAIGRLRPSAVAVAIDYRSDVLVVWSAGGEIYARELPAKGEPRATQRVGRGGATPELHALISDDERAIVAWRSQSSVPARGAASNAGETSDNGRTSLYVSVSAVGVHFGAPTLLESFRDLPGLVPGSCSLGLTRMSSEAVMIAWTGLVGGRYVVRASPVSLRRGVWAPVTVSASAATDPDEEAMLAGLVAGPRAEVLALWSVVPRVGAGAAADGTRRRAIAAAWGHYGGHGEARFAAPETLARPGLYGPPAAGFDPSSDEAIAAWGAGGKKARLFYALRVATTPAATTAASPRAATVGVKTSRVNQVHAKMADVKTSNVEARRPTSSVDHSSDGPSPLVYAGAPALALLAVAGGVIWRGWGRRSA